RRPDRRPRRGLRRLSHGGCRFRACPFVGWVTRREGAVVDVETAVAEAFREEWGQVVATLIRITGDWDVAEECAQEAFALALRTWPRDGVPNRPGAWLTTAARNRATDRLRRDALGAAKLREAALTHVPDESEHDDS